ncbi:MAG: helix-turn-helix transcriptional regulator [Lewinellaceae bacterium]|nr:helix-turn-helix transcriptional regulator [Lewinellaceae bacterium]
MLKFTQKKPHHNLQNYIRSYWLIQSEGVEEPLDLLVPDGYPEMFFVLNESLKMPQFSGEKYWPEHTDAGLIGQATAPFAFQPAPFSKMLFVKFYPWTPQQLFGIPSWQLNDLAIDLGAATTDPAFRQLNQRVCSSQNLTDMVTLLDAFFLKKLAYAPADNSFLAFAVRQIYASNGAISIDQLTQHAHASRRYVEKIFKEKIGMSPKQYARMIRVKKASMYLMDPRFNFNIREIACHLDYYDQSHLLKDFKSVMGQSPSVYLQQKISFSESDLLSYLDQWDYS